MVVAKASWRLAQSVSLGTIPYSVAMRYESDNPQFHCSDGVESMMVEKVIPELP